uniref:PiggyBac transposable element-derived protein domain-containing protein n=1 Tax=Arion vulgaris TaxID=1028688 RepID=A0A0B7BE09_9EUPU
MSDNGNHMCNIDDSDSASECGDESDTSWLSRDASFNNINNNESESSDNDVTFQNADDVGTSQVRSERGTRDLSIAANTNNLWRWRNVRQNELVELDSIIQYQEQQGVTSVTTDYTPIHFFKLFFPDTAIVLITDEMNRYAENHLSQYSGSAKYN